MAVIVRSGLLRQTAQVQSPSETADSYGERDITWITDGTLHRAAVSPISGRERMIVYQSTPDVTHTVRMRNLSTLAPKYRLLVDGTRVFEVVRILDTEVRGHEMIVACTELLDPASATTFSETVNAEFTVTKDLTVDSVNPTTNFEQSIDDRHFRIGRRSSGAYRAMLHFDVSSIPAGATVSLAEMDLISTLELNVTQAGTINRITQTTWSETLATWNTTDGSTAWSPANTISGHTGPFTATDSVACNFPKGSLLGNANLFTVTGLETLVQDAVDNRSGQLHLMCYMNNEGTVGQIYSEFTTKEDDFTVGAAAPNLRVTYVT